MTREEELAALIAEQEADAQWGHRIDNRALSLDHTTDSGASFADIVGRPDDTLAALLGEDESWQVLREDFRITESDARFWRYLYDVKGWTFNLIAEKTGVSISTIHRHVRQASPPRQKRRGGVLRQSRLTVDRVQRAYARYRDEKMSLRQVAEECFEDYGYGSVESCYQGLWHAFNRLGLRMRTHSEANRLRMKHGGRSRSASPETRKRYQIWTEKRARERRRMALTPCRGTTKSGRPCARWALSDSSFCVVHNGLSHHVKWTPITVCDAIAAWEERTGTPPKTTEWQHATEAHPTFRTVYDLFGSWGAALEAAAEYSWRAA